MAFPPFNENGDLPVGIYQATLPEVLEHFGKGSLQRQVVTKRLVKIYRLVKSTNYLERFIIYGSFVTAKPNPNDIDIFLVMDDDFEKDSCRRDARIIFEHLETEKKLGASIFWSRKQFILGNIQLFVEDWQIKVDKTRRGIVEVIENDKE
jgi:hypothetical protein